MKFRALITFALFFTLIFGLSNISAKNTESDEYLTYSDEETGVSFTIPKNWSEKPFLKDKEYLDVKFVHDEDPLLMITYCSIDLWAKMPMSERNAFSSRSELDMSYFDSISNDELVKTLSEYTGFNVIRAKIKQLNGEKYFEVTQQQTVNINGMTTNINQTQMLHIKNGYMYSFSFSGFQEDKHYNDFIKLVKSVNYPVADDNKSTHVSPTVILGLLIIVAAITVISIINESRKKKKKTITCPSCGLVLPDDSTFCHVCGTEIETEEKS